MKKLILVVLAIMLMAGVANAVEPKVSYSYEVTDSEFVKLLGTSVKEDIMGVQGLDIDAWYLLTPPATELKYDEIGLNNLVMPGISYMKTIKGVDIGLNACCGLERIEDITDSSEIGEFKAFAGICIGRKF
jgi:hypothetical protein